MPKASATATRTFEICIRQGKDQSIHCVCTSKGSQPERCSAAYLCKFICKEVDQGLQRALVAECAERFCNFGTYCHICIGKQTIERFISQLILCRSEQAQGAQAGILVGAGQMIDQGGDLLGG